MREIKFRAWDGVMHEDISMQVDYTHNGIKPQIAVELMQYTGLKDKNGVEIYEGDILRDTHESAFGGDSVRTDVVYFNTDPAGFTFGKRWSPLNTVDIRRMEVIGNTYENPELLNV